MKINAIRLPIKAHYFFFMAAMGPILPQLNVFGKQLGMSTVIMGTVTGILPLLFLVAKPIFGFIVDRFRSQRKSIFVTLVIAMALFYALMHFVPYKNLSSHSTPCRQLQKCNGNITEEMSCNKLICEWPCANGTANTTEILAYPSVAYPHEICLNDDIEVCETIEECDIVCKTRLEMNVECTVAEKNFWFFVALMSLGTIGYNVVNSISDAICFDVLGEGAQMAYGQQRVWGTIGFGLSALLSGFVVDWWSIGDIKSFTPAIAIMLFFISIDILCCSKLELPVMQTPENILKDIMKLLKHTHIKIFMAFAALAGIVDSFIVYFFFWYLEELAATTDHMHYIKLLEGIIVAAETLGGEILFFSISGSILERIGYGHSLSMCFVNYALRLGLISVIPSPWWAIPIELCFQGPTYAMCYTTIVAYASAISPPGTSATMQGLVAGIDDGFGYAIGSIFGGVLFRLIGGKAALQVFSAISLVCGIVHFILYKTMLQNKIPVTTNDSVDYKSPEDAIDSGLEDTDGSI